MRSTRMTSAPRSASSAPQYGPAMYRPKSMTRTVQHPHGRTSLLVPSARLWHRTLPTRLRGASADGRQRVCAGGGVARIGAAAPAIFRILADPSRHPDLDGSGMGALRRVRRGHPPDARADMDDGRTWTASMTPPWSASRSSAGPGPGPGPGRDRAVSAAACRNLGPRCVAGSWCISLLGAWRVAQRHRVHLRAAEARVAATSRRSSGACVSPLGSRVREEDRGHHSTWTRVTEPRRPALRRLAPAAAHRAGGARLRCAARGVWGLPGTEGGHERMICGAWTHGRWPQ